MENEEIKKSLEGFEEVWKRVTAAHGDASARSGRTAELMPRKNPQSKAIRFCPPQK